MDRARALEEWDHTAMLLALVANVHRDPARRPSPFTLEDFHPLRSRPSHRAGGDVLRGPQISRMGFEAMRRAFVGGQ